MNPSSAVLQANLDVGRSQRIATQRYHEQVDALRNPVSSKGNELHSLLSVDLTKLIDHPRRAGPSETNNGK